METNDLLAILFFILYFIVGVYFLYCVDKWVEREYRAKLSIIALIMALLLQVFGMALFINDYKNGQIDALKGKYKYRMEINYDQHGTPKDTIYVKEEWRKNMEKDTVVIIPIRTVRDTVIYINR